MVTTTTIRLSINIMFNFTLNILHTLNNTIDTILAIKLGHYQLSHLLGLSHNQLSQLSRPWPSSCFPDRPPSTSPAQPTSTILAWPTSIFLITCPYNAPPHGQTLPHHTLVSGSTSECRKLRGGVWQEVRCLGGGINEKTTT